MYIKSNTNFEEIYQQMFNDIFQYGEWSSDKVRTKYADGSPALRKQIIGYQFRFDNSQGFAPLVRSRFIPIKNAIDEMYWIWIMQSNRVKDLKDLGCKYWDEWMKEDGTIGPAYGYQISKTTMGYKSQLDYIINELKNKPDTTRAMTELYDVSNLHLMALFPCIHLTQWSVLNNKLTLEVRARSQDFALGLCSNIYQYSILHKLVALETGYEVGDIIYSIHNLHYYDRHEENLIKQFENYNSLETKPILPISKIESFTNIFNFKPKDVILLSENKEQPKISYEIAI